METKITIEIVPMPDQSYQVRKTTQYPTKSKTEIIKNYGNRTAASKRAKEEKKSNG